MKSLLQQQPIWLTAKDFIEAHEHLVEPHLSLLQYYSEDLLFTQEARVKFIEPDIKVLP